MNASLLAPFVNGLLKDCFAFQAGNIDPLCFEEECKAENRSRIKDDFLAFAAKRGFVRRRFNFPNASKALAHIFDHLDRYEATYVALADEPSRELFLELLRFRVLGPGHVRLSRNNESFRRFRTETPYYRIGNASESAGRWKLEVFETPGRENPIRVEMHRYGFCITFLQEHYAYRYGGTTITVNPGDVVLDAGACWGDTALYFANHAGKSGRVFSFEFDPSNISRFQSNLALNPGLASRIELVPRALWNKSGETISFNPAGPASRLSPGSEGSASVQTVTIDEFVRENALPSLDFIKMDIEGAELGALQGARESLLRFRPKLAISLYHKPEDFFEIPEFILGLGAGYRIFLSHHTIHAEETVLFAIAKESTP